MMALTGGFSHHILITKSRGLGWRLALRAMVHVTDNNSAGYFASGCCCNRPKNGIEAKNEVLGSVDRLGVHKLQKLRAPLDRSTGEEQVMHPAGCPTTEHSEIQEKLLIS